MNVFLAFVSKEDNSLFSGQFLDILQTKGDEGVQKYIDVLEYDYPHVFKLITNKDAKEPPKSMYS